MMENLHKPQSLILENRANLSLTGVEDVIGFNDETVSLSTSAGDLVVKGSKLHINKLSLDTGEVEIDGTVSLIHYTENKSEKGFIGRLFS